MSVLNSNALEALRSSESDQAVLSKLVEKVTAADESGEELPISSEERAALTSGPIASAGPTHADQHRLLAPPKAEEAHHDLVVVSREKG